jgi:hypothetical protein
MDVVQMAVVLMVAAQMDAAVQVVAIQVVVLMDATPGGAAEGIKAKLTHKSLAAPPTGLLLTQVSFHLAQIEDHFPHGIPNHYVLLDSDSTVSIFCNPELLTDIHDVDVPLYLESNGGGYQVTHQVGTVPNFGEVWFNPDSLANILSLAHVRQSRRVTMDSNAEAAFHVHRPDGGTTIFAEHASGLYLHDTLAHSTANPNSPNEDSPVIIAYTYLQTVTRLINSTPADSIRQSQNSCYNPIEPNDTTVSSSFTLLLLLQ